MNLLSLLLPEAFVSDHDLQNPEITVSVLHALRHAVTLARDEQIRTVSRLSQRLITAGHGAQDVDAALRVWSSYLNNAA